MKALKFTKISLAMLAILSTPLSLPIASADDREPVALEASERDKLLQTMNKLMGGIQAIVEAEARGDRTKIAATASPLGVKALENMPPAIKAKLPDGFKAMSRAMHQSFDQIAAAAQSSDGGGQILNRLSDTLNQCVACHAKYQFVSSSAR